MLPCLLWLRQADVSNRTPKTQRANDEKDCRSRKKQKSSKNAANQYALNSSKSCKPMKSHDDDDDDNKQESMSWLDELELSMPDLSLVPMSAATVVKRLEQTLSHVQTLYVPLVTFLVHCQVQLDNTNNKGVKNMKPRTCHKKYIFPLSQVFTTMSLQINAKELAKAERELDVVSNHAKKGESWTEMKQLFIGGMVGHSSGLYRWVSELGNARSACCDLECILQACCKLDPSLDTTQKLAELLRKMAEPTLDHLMKQVPSKYHLQSTAASASNQHPPLPYFHRLEAAVRSMATFDPNDDEIVCVGDSKISSQAAAVGVRPSSKNDKNNHEIISIDDSDEDEVIKKKCDNVAKKKSEPEVICIDDSDDDDGDEMPWI